MLSDSCASTDFDATGKAIALQREWQRLQAPCVESLINCPDVFDDLLRAGVPVRLIKSSAASAPWFSSKAFELIATPSSSRDIRSPDPRLRHNVTSEASSEAKAYGGEAASPVDSALADLEGMAQLKSGWDGEGAEAPSPEAILSARLLILALSHLDGDWSSTIHSDGRPILERHTLKGYDEIVVDAAGELVIWSERNGRGSSRAVDIADARSYFEQLV